MSKTGNIPAYSDSGLFSRALLYGSCRSKINIYIEDREKEYLCEDILERLFDSKLKFRNVLALGGKTAVLAKCRAAGAYEADGTPNVFIVDGDFDNLWDDQKESLPGLIYLTRYNIESYYCSEAAVLSFLRMYLDLCGDEIEKVFRYEEWEAAFFQEAEPLFFLFALVKKYLPEKPNVGSADRFLDSTGHTCREKMDKYRQEILAELGDITPHMRELEAQIAHNLTGTRKEQLQSLICGKYEVKSLYHSIRTAFHNKQTKKLTYEYFLKHLVMQIETSPLAFLREFIQSQMHSSAVRA